MKGINTWWEEIPGERFWLGIPGRDGNSEVLATPCGAKRNAPCRTNALITHVKDGDAVFHYEEAQRGIVAWSSSRGRVQKRRLIWAQRALGPDSESAAPLLLPSWAIELEEATPLDSVVSLDEIARIQWDLFPALRELEDKVGEPLYYPFTMGSSSETSLLAGYVFKLPALFVECFPALARAAERMSWSAAARARAAGHSLARAEQVAVSPNTRLVPATAHSSGLIMR
jgi:hypothetical protein